MATDIGEGARRAVLAAHHDHAFARIIERLIVARPGDIAVVTDDLPGGPKDARQFRAVEFGVAIGPGGQAPIRVGVGCVRKGEWGNGALLLLDDCIMTACMEATAGNQLTVEFLPLGGDMRRGRS
jgi:hypothetical protein